MTKQLQLLLSCDNISLSICQKFSLFLVSFNAWANHLILDFPMRLFPINLNSNAVFSNLVVFTVFTWPNYSSCFFSNYVNIFWTPDLFFIKFISNSITCCFFLITSQGLRSHCLHFAFAFVRVHISGLYFSISLKYRHMFVYMSFIHSIHQLFNFQSYSIKQKDACYSCSFSIMFLISSLLHKKYMYLLWIKY